MLNKLLKKETLFTIVFVLIALHPFYELDYLIADYLPFRFTTLVNFVIYPLLVVILFFLYEKDKKKTIISTSIYVVILIVYFYFHDKQGYYLENNLYLTNLYHYKTKDEIFYILRLLIPLAYIYIYKLADLKEIIMEKVTICLSFFISLPILISNIIQKCETTYDIGELAGNIFDWFSLPFDETTHHPRNYATKFFFKEGNTISILLIIVLPFMYYFFLKEKDIKKKIGILLLIITDSLAMMIIGTRVAAYGAIIVPVAVILINIFTALIKTDKFNKVFAVVCVLLTLLNAGIFPYCPAYQNQLFDQTDYAYQKVDDKTQDLLKEEKQYVENETKNYTEYSDDWRDYYVNMFETYKHMMGVTQTVYYEYFYDYHIDPKFWVDLIVDTPLEERVNARQIEKIFYNYKWGYMSNTNKLLGFTYSLFMWGGIVIEQDFIQQFYSFGYLGFPLIMGPWIVMLLYVYYKFLRGVKHGKWNMFNIVCLMSMTLAIATSYTSGHGIDQLSTSMFIALICGYLINNLKGDNHGRA